MKIYYRTRKLKKICDISEEAVKKYGQNMARKLQQRLNELSKADSLEQISHLPPLRCHELTGNRKGQLSVDLIHPFRLLFIPADDPPALKENGGIDRERVYEIEIIDITDTH